MMELDSHEQRRLSLLSACLGFGQGCCLCFYVGSGSYYAALFDNPRFFIYLCAFFYLPPVFVSISGLIFDRRCDISRGVRVTLKFRIYLAGSVLIALFLTLCITDGRRVLPYSGQGIIMLGVGSTLGIFGAVMLSASCALVGTINPRMVAIVILSQTAAGVFTNVVADLIGFKPGCDTWRVALWWLIASCTELVVILIFTCFNQLGALESSYQYHESILAAVSSAPCTPQHASRSGPDFSGPVGRGNLQRTQGTDARQISLREGQDQRSVPLSSVAPPINSFQPSAQDARCGFPMLCWSMALCQTCAIAMNMSLTPRANQVAQGSYDLAQTLVLTKLLADFVGRVLFFLLPKPQPDEHGCVLQSVRVHASLAWMVEAVRFLLWLAVFLRSMSGGELDNSHKWTSFLGNKEVLIWAIWLPLISTGAMSSSWCCTLAIAVAPEDQRGPTNGLMTTSIYGGFFVGICVALAS